MPEEIEKVESHYERSLRLSEERNAELHEIRKREFAANMEHARRMQEQHESNMVRDSAISEQARAVATMARDVAKLSNEQAESARLANDREVNRCVLVDVGGAHVNPGSVVAVMDGEDGGSKVMCVYGVSFPATHSRAAVVAAVRAGLGKEK